MELLAIGRFARLSGFTVRAVRHYGELGLLQAAYTDPETGYRYYTTDQLTDAAAIRRLRFLEVALDEIREIVDADDPSFTRARLVQHRAKMAELAATTEQILATLQRLIEGEEELVPKLVDIRDEIEIKEVPAQPVLVIRERAAQEKLSEVIPAAFEQIAKYLHERGLEPVGPPTTICPYADEEGMVDVQNAWTTDRDVPGCGRIEAATLPACTMLAYEHRGHYNELDRSYRALQALVEEEGLTMAGEPREVYWSDPQEVLDPADWVTEIQFPIVRDEARIATLTVTTKS
ncbi:MAG: MerR family transcriptional regulator [Gaiellaceae bacterium]